MSKSVVCMKNECDETAMWFAMRATYRRELAAKKLLDSAGIENFIPMQYRIPAGKRKPVLVPAIHSMIFVRSYQKSIQEFKRQLPWLQYMVKKGNGGKGEPIIIPDRQMDSFIRVASTLDGDLEYLTDCTSRISKGTRVRVRGGSLAGVEGTLARTSRYGDKKVIVSLNGILSVATAAISQDLIEIIDPKTDK